jgi:hypothetical protein
MNVLNVLNHVIIGRSLTEAAAAIFDSDYVNNRLSAMTTR